MKKPKAKFVLAEATLTEVNKQLKLNMLVMVVVVFILFMNIAKFMAEKSFFYAMFVVIMVGLLFFIQKARRILTLRKQELIHK